MVFVDNYRQMRKTLIICCLTPTKYVFDFTCNIYENAY